MNFNGAPKGKLQARVVSPSGAEDNALVQEIDEGMNNFTHGNNIILPVKIIHR